MSLDKEIEDALQGLVKREVPTFLAKVTQVDKEKGTCKVKDDDIEFSNVRLSAVIDGKDKKHFLFPKIGSTVLVGCIDEDIKQLYVEKYSELEAYSLKITNSFLIVDADGFNFKRKTNDLRSLILELIKTIRAMKFTTNTGPTIKLINEPDFITIENKFKTLLKEL